MAEYIEREAAISELMPIYKSASRRNRNVFSTARKCLEAVAGIPAADVAPVVYGKWEKRMEEKETPCYKSFTPIWSCSECGTEYDPSFCMKINFCPNCGAKMTEV